MIYEDLTFAIRREILQVHKDYGPGLFESIYERVLAQRLREIGFDIQTQVPVCIPEKGLEDIVAFKIDVLVEQRVILELKSVDTVSQLHKMQLTSYLKLTGLQIGMLVNFNVPLVLKDGITRIINTYTHLQTRA